MQTVHYFFITFRFLIGRVAQFIRPNYLKSKALALVIMQIGQQFGTVGKAFMEKLPFTVTPENLWIVEALKSGYVGCLDNAR